MESLSLAAAVIQFVEFTSGLISKGVGIHSSLTGLTVDHAELQTITNSLEQSCEEIQDSLKERRPKTKIEHALHTIATGCQAVADELLQVLASLRSKGPRTKWRSIRHAFLATWNESKVQSLEARLDRFRQQIMVNILTSLRQEADDSLRRQASMEASMERIEQLQRSQIPLGDQFVSQVMDGQKWRQDIIRMIHEQGHKEIERLASLAQFKNSKGRTPNAVIAQQKRIRERILHKLAFRNMTDRERRISKAHRRTFEWIFCDPEAGSKPWSSFKGFLERPDRKIYWITGKPGSGKSTLMKYIRHNPQTASFLRTWGGSSQVINAAYYFWNSGSQMQMTVGGLLQTILYECLRQLPDVVQEVLPERWEAATLFDVDDFPWTLEEVAQALRRLDGSLPDKKTQLIELITDLTEDTENLKICVASRPWSNFEDAFRGRSSLMLQDLSASDIEWYISSKFAASPGFVEFQARDPSHAKQLLKDIGDKAEGVFLWVHLVVQSLLEGLTNGDGLRELHNRLKELPPNLEDLYANILENLDDKYLSHASRLFQIVRACDDSPTLLLVALADLEDDNWAKDALVKPRRYQENLALCKNMKRKLASRCRGLLDISSSVDNWQDDDYDDDDPVPDAASRDTDDPLRASSRSISISDASMARLEVQYLHRSVRDYIQGPAVWSWLLTINEEPFDAELALLKSHLLHLKALEPKALSAQQMGFHLWMTIKYAKRSLSKYGPKNKAKRIDGILALMDEVDKTATHLTSEADQQQKSPFVDRSGILGGDHWSSFFLLRVSDPCFLHMMAISGIHQYLDRRRGLNMPHKGPGDISGAPLLIAALEGSPIVPQFDTQGYKEVVGPHPKVLKVLLQQGEDCHEVFQGISAWDLANSRGWAEILELFEEYRGKPPAKPRRQNYTATSAHRRHCEQGGGADSDSDVSTTAVASGQTVRSLKSPPRQMSSATSRAGPATPRNDNFRSSSRHSKVQEDEDDDSDFISSGRQQAQGIHASAGRWTRPQPPRYHYAAPRRPPRRYPTEDLGRAYFQDDGDYYYPQSRGQSYEYRPVRSYWGGNQARMPMPTAPHPHTYEWYYGPPPMYPYTPISGSAYTYRSGYPNSGWIA